LHEVEAPEDWYLPEGQTVHEPDPTEGCIDPAGQEVQEEAMPVEKYPTSQSEQDGDAELPEYLPVGQPTQAIVESSEK
jgi:hypothetical protein